MIRLFLLRHATAAMTAPGGSDFDRGLTVDGRQAAGLVGRFMADHGLIPDHILCSGARRTRETLDAVRTECPIDVDPLFSGEVYAPGSETYLPLLRQTPANCEALLLVGHNPVIQRTARRLAGDGDRAQLALLALDFPTAALAVIAFDALPWSQLDDADGRLVTFGRVADGRVVTSAAERDDED
jgi:phosphohistidine phosphatase